MGWLKNHFYYKNVRGNAYWARAETCFSLRSNNLKHQTKLQHSENLVSTVFKPIQNERKITYRTQNLLLHYISNLGYAQFRSFRTSANCNSR